MRSVESARSGRARRSCADEVEVLAAGVAATHAAQHAVGARLHRQMQIGADVGVPPHLLHHPRREVARVGGDEAQPLHARHAGDRVEQVGEVPVPARLAPVVDGLPQQLDLLESVVEEVPDLAPGSRRIGRLRSGPRVLGTMQKVQFLLHPSMIVTIPLYSPWPGDRVDVVLAVLRESRSATTRSPARRRATTSCSSPTRAGPSTKSRSGTRSRAFSPSCWATQPQRPISRSPRCPRLSSRYSPSRE